MKEVESVKISYIELENITVYDNVSIEIPDTSYNIVLLNSNDTNITNGSGKTSIVYSILSTLNIIKSFKGLKRIGSEGNSKISVTFKKDDTHTYTITRIFDNRKSDVTIQPDIFNIRIKDKIDYFVDTVIKDTNKIYSLTHVFVPGKEQIYDLSSVQIFRIIEKIIYNKDLEEYIKEIKNQQSTLQIQQSKLISEIETLKSSKNKFESLLKNIQQQFSTETIQKKVNELNKYMNDLNELKKYFNPELEIDFNGKSNEITQLVSSLEIHVKNEINEIEKKLVELKTSEQTHTKKIKELNHLKDLQKCPTCYRPITKHDVDIYTQLINDETDNLLKVSNERKQIEQQHNELKTKLNKVQEFKQMYNRARDVWKVVNEQIEQNDNQIKQIEENIRQIEQQIVEKSKLVEELEVKLKHINLIVELLNVKSPVRKNFLSQYISKMNSIAKSYSSYVLNKNEEFEIVYDDESISFGIIRDDVFIPYQLLSNGERKKVSIIFILTILTILNIFKTAPELRVLIFDDFFNGIDNSNVLKVLQLLYDFSKQYDYQIIISNNNIQEIPFEYVNVQIKKDYDTNLSTVEVSIIN
jgi:DNA repair exonuclease SbcCD ATPase subunit